MSIKKYVYANAYVNKGALVSVCADDQLHLWSLRQRKPEIVHSLKFQRERFGASFHIQQS